MQNYKNLSTAYLKAGRVRSVVTIIGVALTVMVLYGGLNFGWSYLLYGRVQVRTESDYEFILLADSEEEAQRIAADERVEKAYVGAYEYTEWVSIEEYRDEYDEDYEATTETYYDQYGNVAGTGYGSDDYVEVNHVVEHALYATGKNPYRMEKTMNELADDYGVEAVLNIRFGLNKQIQRP